MQQTSQPIHMRSPSTLDQITDTPVLNHGNDLDSSPLRHKSSNAHEYSYPTASNAMRDLLEPNTHTHPTEISEANKR